jgi:hypothetical protein
MAAFFMDLLTVRRLLVLRVVLRCATTSSPLCRSSTPHSGGVRPGGFAVANVPRAEDPSGTPKSVATLVPHAAVVNKDCVGRMKASEADGRKVQRSGKIGDSHKHVGSYGSAGLTNVSGHACQLGTLKARMQQGCRMQDAGCRANDL